MREGWRSKGNFLEMHNMLSKELFVSVPADYLFVNQIQSFLSIFHVKIGGGDPQTYLITGEERRVLTPGPQNVYNISIMCILIIYIACTYYILAELSAYHN